CWRGDLGLKKPQTNMLQCFHHCKMEKSCRVHVHNVQVCYICILVPCWCAAPINLSFTMSFSFKSV
uniref:Uncharacterized protein n=1 Tax=Macaca fascicularis TaxID=9541 RepID=A0A7N9IAX4_MACFA